jgi:hypothetical protein
LPSRTHSYQPSAGRRQRRRANDGANAGDVATVSARALIIRAPARGSVTHGGMRPHRALSRTLPAWRCESRTTGTGSVGATFQLGPGPAVIVTASNSALRSASVRVVAYRPHMPVTLRPCASYPGLVRQDGAASLSAAGREVSLPLDRRDGKISG